MKSKAKRTIITFVVALMFVVMGFSQCGAEPEVIEIIRFPESRSGTVHEVVYHPMGNGISCYTYREQMQCFQISE